MSKSRSMYAGSSGMINGTNAMCVQIGNKLQGLPPTTNKPAQLINHITTKAHGDKRDHIFCINQLAGGVGRNVGQFTTGADGVKDCTNGKFVLNQNACEFLNCEALNTWVDTELSSLFATMSQGAGNIVSNNTSAKGYLGLAVVPKALLGSGGTYSAVAAGSSAQGTITSFMIDITAFADPTTTFASVTNNSVIPDLDIIQFIQNGSSAATTITNLNGDFTSFPQSSTMVDFIAALQASVDANPTVKQTLATFLGKDLKVDGYGASHKLVAHILPETFIQTSLFDNMNQWLLSAVSAGDRSSPTIWNLYYLSGGSHNGFTQMVNTRHVTNPQFRTNFINTCDLGGFAIPTASDAAIIGATQHILNTFVLNSNYSHLSFYYLV
jgi:hypothetical protein